MNRDDIIRMAREAGLPLDWISESGVLTWSELERFAALVADHEREILRRDGWRKCAAGQRTTQFCAMAEEAMKAEREACARIASSYGGPKEPMMVGTYEAGWHNAAETIAADIRARGEEPKRHPGYIIGDHWLQAAYTRVCTGEDIRQVMEDYGYYP